MRKLSKVICSGKIHNLRKRLDKLLLTEPVNSDTALELSKKLDVLIVKYCRLKKKRSVKVRS